MAALSSGLLLFMLAFNATVLLLWLAASAIAPYESEGVYYALIGGNHVMHFRQSYWKKLVRGAIRIFILEGKVHPLSFSIRGISWNTLNRHTFVPI